MDLRKVPTGSDWGAGGGRAQALLRPALLNRLRDQVRGRLQTAAPRTAPRCPAAAGSGCRWATHGKRPGRGDGSGRNAEGLVEFPALALRALGRFPTADQEFKLTPALATLIFVEWHDRVLPGTVTLS